MAGSDIREQVDLIREVFAYTERFKGSTFVIKIDNEIIDHPDFPQHARDIALLQKAGIRTVLVPGADKRVDEVLNQFGVGKRFIDGIRVCEAESMDLINMAAFDTAHRVMTALSGHKITAVIGNWVKARSRGVIDGIDFGRAGRVERIRVEAVVKSLEQGHVPIFPGVGHNESGDPFNLSADELAGTVATALHAQKLFFLTPYPEMRTTELKPTEGVYSLGDGRIFRMPPQAVPGFLAANPAMNGRVELETAAMACRGGVDRAHILDGRQGGVLLKESFSNLGVGTMVYADAYEHLRPMELQDVAGILEIMQPLIAEGVLVQRTREDLKRRMKDYWVYDMDGVVHGCAALHIQGSNSAEIAGLAVDPRFAQLGIGTKLISRLSENASEQGIRQLFVLTTHAADWFLARGFREGSINDLPDDRRKEYNASRNSRVLVRDISAD